MGIGEQAGQTSPEQFPAVNIEMILIILYIYVIIFNYMLLGDPCDKLFTLLSQLKTYCHFSTVNNILNRKANHCIIFALATIHMFVNLKEYSKS